MTPSWLTHHTHTKSWHSFLDTSYLFQTLWYATMVNYIFNYGIFISKQMKKRCSNTYCISSGNAFRAFWNVSSSAQLDSSCNLIWISKYGISPMFSSLIDRSKRAHTNDSCVFLGPEQPYINARAIIDQTSQSHHCLIFFM